MLKNKAEAGGSLCFIKGAAEMSPEFIRFKKILKEIISNHNYAIDIQFIKDNYKSDDINISMVLYCYYEKDNWEYHWFAFPRREENLTIVEFHNFLDFMI